jgi:hypothetical protein
MLLPFFAVMVASFLPARAAVEWRCSFGPASSASNDVASFDFYSGPSLGDDEVGVEGTGSCTTTGLQCYGDICEIADVSSPASLRGKAAEPAGWNLQHFGRCDHDPLPDAARQAGLSSSDLWVRVPIRILIGDRTFDRALTFPAALTPSPLPLLPRPPPSLPTGPRMFAFAGFPNAYSFHGDVRPDVRGSSQVQGSVSFYTRLAGACPPHGSFKAFFDSLTFTD